MSQYAVLHITKYKELGGIGAHIDRHHVPENANPEKVDFNENLVEYGDMKLLDILGDTIDKDKTYLNHLHNNKPTNKLSEDVWKRIREGHTVIHNKSGKVAAIPHNSVLALGVILTGSHERMKEIEADKKLFRKWIKANYDFACKLFTKENIVRFTLHMDEKTPHFHCVVVPINKEGRLSARSFINGSGKLRRFQDMYAEAMAPFGLERGIHKELTHRVHIPTAVFNRSVKEQHQKKKEAIEQINVKNFYKFPTIKQTLLEETQKAEVKTSEAITKNHYTSIINKTLTDKHKVKAYEKALEHTAGRTYDWIKTNIEMIPFLTQELGWTIDKSKGIGSYARLSHPEHGKIIVRTTPNPKTGHWVFKYVHGGGGTLIDLLEDAGWNADKIRSLASGKFIPSPVDTTAYRPPIKKHYIEEDPVKQTQKAQAYLDTITNVTKHPFLEDRAIERKTYQSLESLKVSGQTAAFALYKDFDEDGKARLCSTISYYKDHLGNHEKRFQGQLPRGLSILKEKGLNIQQATKIVITESPVDALSYRQLVLNGEEGWKRVKSDAFGTPLEADIAKTVFISTCGNLVDNITIELEHLFKLAARNSQLVALALDNDAAGIHMREILVHMLENAGCNYLIEIPKYGKDWNEIVMQGPLPSIEAAIEATKEMAQSQWALFEEGAYATSLLNCVGIEESTYHAFQSCIKVNDQAMVMALHDIASNELVDTWTLQGDPAKGKKFESYIHATDTPVLAILQGNPIQADQVVLVASPIDALIHYQNQENKDSNTAYVYAHAATRSQLEGVLIDFVGQTEPSSVVLATSPKNSHLLKDLEEVLQSASLAYTHTLVEVRKPVRQSAASKSWEALEEKPYAESLLKQLGIEKATAEAFRDTIKANEKTIMVALKDKKTIETTWSLQWDPERGMQVYAEKGPIISVLKGNIEQAKQAVLVVSPMEALIHYQTQERKEDICYIYVDARSKEAAQEPLQQFKKFARDHHIDVSIARYGEEHGYLAKRVQYLFKEDSLKAYTHRMKKEIPLVPFLTEQMGWILNTQASDDQKAILNHPMSGEQLSVPPQAKPSGQWIYRDAEGEEGNIVDMMLDQKWDWKQIIAFADSKLLLPIEVIEEGGIDAAYSILTTRSIEKETLEHLLGVKANLKEAVFDLYKDFNPITGEASLCSHVTYAKDKDGNNSRYFEKGMPRGISILQEEGQTLKEASTLIITDTPIDALSYRQLSAGEDTSWKHIRKATEQAKEMDRDTGKAAYLSTSGYFSPSMYEDLKQVAKLAKEDKKTVVLAFNADTEGQSMARSLSYVLKNEEVAYRVEVPRAGKSWNEVLTQKRDPHRLEDGKRITAELWAAFEEKPYEQSLLHRLGIEKPIYEAFQLSIKTNHEDVLVALEMDKNKEEVVASWNLHWDKERGYKEYIDPGPAVSILKGNIKQAERIVLTTSPLEALLHYQKELQATESVQEDVKAISQEGPTLPASQMEEQGVKQDNKPAFTTLPLDNLLSYNYQKELQAAESKEASSKLSTVSKQATDEDLAKINNTCYIYVNAKEKRHLLEGPLNRVLEEVQSEKKELVIAASKGMNRLTDVLEQVLEKQQYQYSKATVEVPTASQGLAASLGSGISLLAALASTNRSISHEDEDEEEIKKGKSVKRGI